MDEATSNLDSITEKAIEKTINDLSGNITTIIIAHRLSTIMRCDKIYVMEQGKFIEQGTHNELLDSKGRYYKLWKDQMPDIYTEENVNDTGTDNDTEKTDNIEAIQHTSVVYPIFINTGVKE